MQENNKGHMSNELYIANTFMKDEVRLSSAHRAKAIRVTQACVGHMVSPSCRGES